MRSGVLCQALVRSPTPVQRRSGAEGFVPDLPADGLGAAQTDRGGSPLRPEEIIARSD
jgi:hypothetical protein